MKQELKLDDLSQVAGGAMGGSVDYTGMENALRNAWNALGFGAHGVSEHVFEAYLDEFTAGNYVSSQAYAFLETKKTW
ncbi:MAG: hypothetical protein IJT32_00505 [Lachnospiraceae bacterium]|nr:hypothetical protein [Lachnospiraceae bacterium]